MQKVPIQAPGFNMSIEIAQAPTGEKVCVMSFQHPYGTNHFALNDDALAMLQEKIPEIRAKLKSRLITPTSSPLLK